MDKTYKDLIQQYPILFKMASASEMETCMCWGIEAGIGWYNPLNELCSYLEELNNVYYTKYKIRIQADQIKEKFGELRFYYSIIDDETTISNDEKTFIGKMLNTITDILIKKYEDECWNVCEWCGADGGFNGENLITTKGWISRICKKCAKEYYFKDQKHLAEEVEKTNYSQKIDWFNNAFEFLNLYTIDSFKYTFSEKTEYYTSIIEAFYCIKDQNHAEIYKKIAHNIENINSSYLIQSIAKSYGIEFQDNEEDYKLLKSIVKAKYTYEFNKNIKQELIETKNIPLSNRGLHHDNVLGVCNCDSCKNYEHKDLYAKILMEVRSELISELNGNQKCIQQ